MILLYKYWLVLFFYSDSGLEALIGFHEKAISLVDLKSFPPFIRFERVWLQYFFGSQSIEKKCQLFEGFLPSIKGALNAKKIVFNADISQNDPSNFSNHSSLVQYIRERLLIICDCDCQYVFRIGFYSDENSKANVIKSILKMPQIVRCPNVEIKLYYIYDSIQLPVKEIFQWLNQTADRIGVSGKKKDEKFLRIYSWSIENILGMCEHLSEVVFNS